MPFTQLSHETANHWLLPDGITDVLFDEAYKQEILRHKLTEQLICHGYELVSPPFIEYTESLLSGASEDLKRQTFKIIDQLTGRLMGVRADITPQILRIDAHHGGDGIARYCYAGHVIHTLPTGLFGSRTPLQLGAEIFGCAAISADIELIDVLMTLLHTLTLSADLHIDLGHVAIFERLRCLARLSNTDTERFMHLYANKNLPELKQVCQRYEFGDDFYALARYGHDTEQLLATLSDAAKQDRQLIDAIDELHLLKDHIQTRWQGNVSIDITELSGYHYHTGIIFNGYINNEPQPLVRGGRFDGMQSRQSSEPPRAATGFSMDVSRLLPHAQLESARVIVVDHASLLAATPAQSAVLQQRIETLRQQGCRVTIPLNDQDRPSGLTHRLTWRDSDWQVVATSD